MIVKIRYENQWTYIADVARIKTEEKAMKDEREGTLVSDVPILTNKLYIFYKDPNRDFEIVELIGNVVYLLTDEGKTIERIN